MPVKRVLLGLQTLVVCLPLVAQDPTGVLRGQITDPSAATVPNAEVIARNTATGFAATQESSQSGNFHFSYLPVGEYDLHISATGFADFAATHIRIDVDRTVNFAVALELRSRGDLIDVTANAATVDVSSALGNVISSRDAVDLPLNGRNFTQLGLLQPGVAPMTFGLAQAGGIARSGQAYAVNGQPPESNNYLLDGVSNVD
ncbi:MAG: carboxypeptidase-like regulatory domain-containing protein, partial [Bryobacteraceae bacterium]